MTPILAAVCTGFALAVTLAQAAGTAPRAEVLGVHDWAGDDPDFGGLSGFDLCADGLAFRAVTDRGVTLTGRLVRDADGRVIGVESGPLRPLRDARGQPVQGRMVDAEGLALACDQDREGGFFVSFELVHRIVFYPGDDQPAESMTAGLDLSQFQENGGFEALARATDGTLYALPERPPSWRAPYPLYRHRGAGWDIPLYLPASGTWLPVGADVGPDGRLYLLERDYWGFVGFMSRLRRLTLEGDRLIADEVLFESRAGQYDNLESLAVWTAADGSLRITAVSDDNFLPWQQTQLVDLRVTE